MIRFPATPTLFLILAMLWLHPTIATAQSAEDKATSPTQLNGTQETNEALLARAENLYEYGDYPKMVELLETALEAERFDDDQLATVHRLLGIGYFILQNKPKAREHMLRLLTREPETKLDPLYVPPIIVEYFEQIREENKEMLDAIIAQNQQKEEERKLAESQKVIRHHNPYFVNFIPFGAGQYQNSEPVKGTLFLTLETATLGLNIVGYFVSSELRGDDNMYTESNAQQARAWRIVQYSALGAFGALIIGGIIDAVLNYEPYTEEVIKQPKAEDLNDSGKAAALAPEVDWKRLRIRF